MNVIDPRGMSVTDWCDAMVIELEQFGNLGRLDDEMQWQEWASQLLNLPGISGSIVPDPYAFSRWEDWAARVNDGLAAVM